MKLCVLENLYGNKTLEESLSILTSLGVHTVEVGAGGYPGKAHCNPAELLADEAKLAEFKNTFAKYGISICALAAHGNPLHPNKELAAMYDKEFKEAVLLAEKLGVDVEFVEITWGNKHTELETKGIDVVWNGMTLTDAVMEAMECSNAYCNNAQVVVLPAAE